MYTCIITLKNNVHTHPPFNLIFNRLVRKKQKTKQNKTKTKTKQNKTKQKQKNLTL